MAFRIKCHQCDEAIGVYEPIILVVGGQAHETSRAADPGVDSAPGERYHSACYIERFGSEAG